LKTSVLPSVARLLHPFKKGEKKGKEEEGGSLGKSPLPVRSPTSPAAPSSAAPPVETKKERGERGGGRKKRILEAPTSAFPPGLLLNSP